MDTTYPNVRNDFVKRHNILRVHPSLTPFRDRLSVVPWLHQSGHQGFLDLRRLFVYSNLRWERSPRKSSLVSGPTVEGTLHTSCVSPPRFIRDGPRNWRYVQSIKFCDSNAIKQHVVIYWLCRRSRISGTHTLWEDIKERSFLFLLVV